MVRIRERDPEAEWPLVLLPYEVDGAIGYPSRVVPSDWELGRPHLRRAVVVAVALPEQLVFQLAAAVGVIPFFVGEAGGWALW